MCIFVIASWTILDNCNTVDMFTRHLLKIVFSIKWGNGHFENPLTNFTTAEMSVGKRHPLLM